MLKHSYYRNCDGIVLVYDITKQDTFNNLTFWLEQINEKTDDPQVTIVGNKSDLANLRTVSTKEAQKLADQNNVHFSEASALDWSNVADIFDELVDRIVDDYTKRGGNDEAGMRQRDQYRFDSRRNFGTGKH